MIKLIKYFFDKWWLAILFWFLACLTFGLSEIIKNKTFGNIALLLFGTGLLIILISSIYLLAKKKWLTGLLNLALFGGTVIAFILYAMLLFIIDQSTPDPFAHNLKIPENIQLEQPLDTRMDDDFKASRPDSITHRQVLKMDFQLYNSFQPGLYEYDFWTNKIDNGTIYLKAFEITQEYALSTDRLPEQSSIKIYNPTESIMMFGTSSHFTIYEGDWGQPYAARFEVWFKPEDGKPERKLLSKNYKIEGWMR